MQDDVVGRGTKVEAMEFLARGNVPLAGRPFLVDREGIIRGAWRYETGQLPDFDELLSAARSLS